jgi:glycosyltransferase involved in cell wall biosynthesis
MVDLVGFQVNPDPSFRHSDVFGLSSRAEGFGIVMAEALGCGTPVISTGSGHGPSEILALGRHGILVPPKNPAAMAAALCAAGEDPRFPPEPLKAGGAESVTRPALPVSCRCSTNLRLGAR